MWWVLEVYARKEKLSNSSLDLHSSHKSIFMHLEIVAQGDCCWPICLGCVSEHPCKLPLPLLCHRSLKPQGIWGVPCSGLGQAVSTPPQNQGSCSLGQSPSFCMEMGPRLPGTVDRQGAAEPAGGQLHHSLPPPHPATWAMVESPKFVSGDCFLHHLPL